MRGGGGGGGVFDRACKGVEMVGARSQPASGWDGKAAPHHTKERVNVRVTPRVHGAPFFVRSSLYFFRCDAQILEARPQNAHEPLMGIYCRLHPHECVHACMHAYSAVQCRAHHGAWWHQP